MNEGIALRTAKSTDQVALRALRLAARVAGTSVRATLEQTFVNLEPDAIEAWYTFPLPEGAAVCGFEVIFFDRVFTGVVEETDKAIDRYEDAIAQGDGAYLVERHRPDVFSVRVGNLKPRQAVTIRLTYVMDLEVVDRGIRLAFPTTVAPRFVSSAGTDPIDAAVDGDALNPPHVLSVPYGLWMDLDVDLGNKLVGITSPSHSIEVRRAADAEDGVSPTQWSVRLAAGMTETDRDVVLNIELAREQAPFAVAAQSPDGERFVAVNFLPEFDVDDFREYRVGPAPETVFVLDCSGSMAGESLRQATAALECCLRAMSRGDVFNVCRFGSTFDFLSFEPLVYSASTLAAAVKYVRQAADLGGTELFAPLDAIFRQPPRGGARNIVLLTDGQVSNEPAIIALAKRKRTHNRLFAFGIGSACSQFLVKGLARVTGGAAEFIAANERIEEKVLRTFGRLASPPVTGVEIDWGDADVQVAPRVLPPVFDGDALRVFGRIAGGMPDTVTLRCNTPTGPREWQVEVRPAPDHAAVLPPLWARAMIRAIEEEDDIRASAAAPISSPDRAKLIQISKRYGVLCSLTSFVAVEHRSAEERYDGRPALRRVPVTIAKDWGGADQTIVCASLDRSMDRSLDRSIDKDLCGLANAELLEEVGGAFDTLREAAPAAYHAVPAPKQGVLGRLAGRVTSAIAANRARFAATKRYAMPSATPPGFTGEGGGGEDAADHQPAGDFLIDLLAHQTADGSFDETAATNRAIGASGVDREKALAAIDRLLDSIQLAGGPRHKARQTLLVLVVFAAACANRQATWKRAHHKAVMFLRDAAGLAHGETDRWVTEVAGAARTEPPSR